MFEAAGWEYVKFDNGNNIEQVYAAVQKAFQMSGERRPIFVDANTVMSKRAGFPYEDDSEYHGKPFSEKDLPKVLENLGAKDFDWRKYISIRAQKVKAIKPRKFQEPAEPLLIEPEVRVGERRVY